MDFALNNQTYTMCKQISSGSFKILPTICLQPFHDKPYLYINNL